MKDYIDPYVLEILKIVKENPRIGLRKLIKLTKKSPQTISKRIKWLVKNGYLTHSNGYEITEKGEKLLTITVN